MSTSLQPSDTFSTGVEMEFQLVDAESYDLAERVMPLLDFYPDSRNIKPEIIQTTIEVSSDPCGTLPELDRHLRTLVGGLVERSAELGLRLCGAGTHPFTTRLATITPHPRYEALERVSGILSHRQITFATHVHFGMPSGEEALMVMRELKPYLPLLIALSASSPFWKGLDTGFAAYRHRVLASSRSYGTPPDFRDWSDFDAFFSTMRRAQVFETIDDIHWDVRPRPTLGSLEVRIMDAQPTVSEAMNLVALIRALIAYLRATRHVPKARLLSPLPWWAQKDNCFMASRFGLDALVIVDRLGEVFPLRSVILRTIDAVVPHIDLPQEAELVKRLAATIDGALPYQRMRSAFFESASLAEVVSTLADELEGDLLTHRTPGGVAA